MYKLIKNQKGDVDGASEEENGVLLSFPFNPENTDYQNFKIQINNETAQLETANGVLLTPDEAKAYVATLP